MKYQQEIHAYLQTKKQEIVTVLKDLIEIPSVRGETEENAPFGKDCAKILKFVQKLYEKDGFETELDEKGGYLLSYFGESEKTLGLFSHADVVSTGDDWIHARPFEPIEKDGCLIGRGALDDKSAVVCALYILKLIKDLSLPLKRKIVCFTGSNEETGMQDIENYKDKHLPPDFSFALDTAFPLYRGNKGVLHCNVKAKTRLKDILCLQGGDSTNVTLGKTEGLLPYDKELYSWLKERETERIRIGVKDEKIVLTAMGISKHGALPEGSLNAGWLLAELLKDCPFICEEDRTQMRVLSIVLSDIYGEKTGIATEDAEFGKLTCSNGIVKTEDGKISFTLDIRFGEKRFVSQLENTLTSTFEQMDYEVEFLLGRNAHIIAEDNPYVQTCMDVYKEFTGDALAKTRINAGGTYAMRLPCAVEIGTTTIWGAFKEMPNGHGGAHQPDECISINGFLEAIELTALMVLACDKLSGKK